MHQIGYRFSKFSRGFWKCPQGPAEGGLQGAPQENDSNVLNYSGKLTNASECTNWIQIFLTPRTPSWRGKEHPWEGRTRPSEFLLLGGLMEYDSSLSLLAAETARWRCLNGRCMEAGGRTAAVPQRSHRCDSSSELILMWMSSSG